ncbi:MAG: cell division protein ZapA [Chloroflexota bacterium]
MKKSVKLEIDGKPFALKCDDVEVTTRAARELDSSIRALRQTHSPALSDTTAMALVALNIFEENLKIAERTELTIKDMTDELNKMADYLLSALD